MGGVDWGRRAGVDGNFLLKYREVTATEVMRSFIGEPLRIPRRKHGFQLAFKSKTIVDCSSLHEKANSWPNAQQHKYMLIYTN